MERIREQETMKKKGLKQMQSSLKWNLKLKPSSNTYPYFDVIFKGLLVIFLEQDFEA